MPSDHPETPIPSANELARQPFEAVNHAFSEAQERMRRGAEDFSRMFSDMKFPGMPDMDMLLAAHRRNVETLTAANRVALEGAQAVARRNIEIMHQTLSELGETMKGGMAGIGTGGAKDQASKQAELLRGAYERAVSSMREVSELIQKSNAEALSLLNTRFTEAVDEVKTLMGRARSV